MKRNGIPEIARKANVSLATVDRAFHGRKGIKKETRQRILRIAKELGYRPNIAARALSAGRRTVRIGVCIPLELHYFYDQMRQGIKAEAAEFEDFGLELIDSPSERLGVKEYDHLHVLLSKDIQAVILCPGDYRPLTPLIGEMEDRGIRVICVSSDAPDSQRSSLVWVDPYITGELAGELMAKVLPEGSQAAVVTGILQSENHRKKTEAFTSEFKKRCAGGKVVEVIEAHDDELIAFERVLALLRHKTGISGLYVSTANCLPVCHALAAQGLLGKVRLITTDLFPEMVPYFRKGGISASIYQRPYNQAQIALRIAVNYILHRRPLLASHCLSPQIVMNANLHLFRETHRLSPHPNATSS